jgi:hypothetical protein
MRPYKRRELKILYKNYTEAYTLMELLEDIRFLWDRFRKGIDKK